MPSRWGDEHDRPRHSGGKPGARAHTRDERGSITAEFAVALPAVLLVFALGIGALSASAQHVRLQDAVADAARLVARGDDPARGLGLVAAAVTGASAVIEHRGDLVCVVGRVDVRVGVVLTIGATSCALEGGR